MGSLIERLGLAAPLIQAPMAGVSTPDLAAAVTNAGALGSIGIGATDVAGARAMISQLRGRTDGPFNVNVFVHATPVTDTMREATWLEALRPEFARFNAQPPQMLRTIYTSFRDDPAMLAMLVECRPPVVSFHFGLPGARAIAALRDVGCLLIATATSLAEAETVQAADLDAIVAQGYEAGGHRGVFDPCQSDDQLRTMALTRLLAAQANLPVIAAGGIMDGGGIRAALDLGAQAVQMGTAFIACPESSADAAYRAALTGQGAWHTTMTRAISGRPARCLANHFTRWGEGEHPSLPDYPIAYDAGKALNAAAKAGGDYGYGAQWAGQGAPLARPMPAADLVALLRREAGL